MSFSAESSNRFSVGLSFPGEHRDFVESVAERLAEEYGKDRVLYDHYYDAEFARPDLDLYLPGLYRTESDLIVVFLCPEYIEKRWCRLEWKYIRQLLCTVDECKIMFLSFGDPGDLSEVGVLNGDGYIDANNSSSKEVAEKIIERHSIEKSRVVSSMSRPKVKLSRLSSVSLPRKPGFVGRENELSALHRHWRNPSVKIVSIIGEGGKGKTSLLTSWINEFDKNNYNGATHVFGWTFNTVGTGGSSSAYADEFIDTALKWFGDSDPSRGSAWEKGERLAEFVASTRTLLILDGVEALQKTSGNDEGQMTETVELRSLFLTLQDLNGEGLCVVTGQLPLSDIDISPRGHEVINLGNLSLSEGRSLLGEFNVLGSRNEVNRAVEELDGHPLSLTLLGAYLDSCCDNDIRRRHEFILIDQEGPCVIHAHAILNMCEKRYEGDPELQILMIVGMFDREVSLTLLDELRRPPVINGLNEQIVNLDDHKWHSHLSRLVRSKLIDRTRGENCDSDKISTHRFIREYFGERLQERNPDAWRLGHERLYKYILDSVVVPEECEQDHMMPLFDAMVHGCHAQRHSEVLEDVYWKSIAREKFSFHDRPIHSYQLILTHLYLFCKQGRTEPLDMLSDDQKGLVLEEIGHYRFLQGRLDDALPYMEAGLSYRIKQENWQQASKYARIIAELLLMRARFGESKKYAEQSVELALNGCREDDHVKQFSGLGYVCSHLGEFEEARVNFLRAEDLHKKQGATLGLLCAYDGYWYSQYLIDRWKHDFEEVMQVHPELLSLREASRWLRRDEFHKGFERLNALSDRTEKIICHCADNNWAMDTALGRLAGGQVQLFRGLLKGEDLVARARGEVELAVKELRSEGQQHHLSVGLLKAAFVKRISGDLCGANEHLDELLQVSKRSRLRLPLADYHLEKARYCIASGEQCAGEKNNFFKEARGHILSHKKLVGSGYKRRHREVRAIEQALCDC